MFHTREFVGAAYIDWRGWVRMVRNGSPDVRLQVMDPSNRDNFDHIRNRIDEGLLLGETTGNVVCFCSVLQRSVQCRVDQ